MRYNKLFIRFFLLIIIFIYIGCIDDSPVAYNEYEIMNVTPPVPKQGAVSVEQKKVHIGHDLPVSLTLKVEYNEKDIPIQFYLLNVNDVEEVENGVGDVNDIRTYYCHQTELTTIKEVVAGTSTYGLIINIPSDDSIDDMTGDRKTGLYYILADTNKNEDAEIDIITLYDRFKDKLDDENIIEITSDFMRKPDLSIESMNFTGTEDEPNDVMTFYNLVLNTLPGGEDLPTIYVPPSETDRTFTGTVAVKSSASDALNVPIKFYIKDEAGKIPEPGIELNIYDKAMGGYVDTYYIPILKANTTERITVALSIPGDTGPKNYFNESNYDDWETDSPVLDDYPLSAIRHAMGKEDYKAYNFNIVATVNPNGEVTESRFIIPNDDNSEYVEADYKTDGDEGGASTLLNNTKTENLSLVLEKMKVEENKGIRQYPCSELSGCGSIGDDTDYKTIVIFWDGLSLNVGDDMFGATAEAHEGMFFLNYSLYSFGVDLHGTIFKQNIYLVNTYLDAESYPYDASKSGFEFHIEGGFKTILSEAGAGHSENNWEYPIILFSKEKTIEKWYYCFKFTLTAGMECSITPGLNLNLNQDGSLDVEKYLTFVASADVDASASIAGLATVGVYTFMDVITLLMEQNTYTETQFDEENHPGEVRGTLNRDVGVYIIGPKGYVYLYFEIDLLLFSIRYQTTIFSYSTFKIPILEIDFEGSGLDTNWMRVSDADTFNYSTPEAE